MLVSRGKPDFSQYKIPFGKIVADQINFKHRGKINCGKSGKICTENQILTLVLKGLLP